MSPSQLALPATSAAPHLFWLLSRAAGSAALVLSSLSVCLGLLMGGRLLKRRGTDLRVTHEALSLATLATLLVHGLSLLGDGFLHPSLADVAIPFAGAYKTLWTSAGIVAFWALAALGLSYYARGRIGQQRWRKLHRYTALAWALATSPSTVRRILPQRSGTQLADAEVLNALLVNPDRPAPVLLLEPPPVRERCALAFRSTVGK